mmetsp:Transcript_112191/g.322524  ORF Transcript_112191/g.322524 Transcript_112191/m.322524 type:complete len:330 (+) Transcript_112191:86-1075(+)
MDPEPTSTLVRGCVWPTGDWSRMLMGSETVPFGASLWRPPRSTSHSPGSKTVSALRAGEGVSTGAPAAGAGGGGVFGGEACASACWSTAAARCKELRCSRAPGDVGDRCFVCCGPGDAGEGGVSSRTGISLSCSCAACNCRSCCCNCCCCRGPCCSFSPSVMDLRVPAGCFSGLGMKRRTGWGWIPWFAFGSSSSSMTVAGIGNDLVLNDAVGDMRPLSVPSKMLDLCWLPSRWLALALLARRPNVIVAERNFEKALAWVATLTEPSSSSLMVDSRASSGLMLSRLNSGGLSEPSDKSMMSMLFMPVVSSSRGKSLGFFPNGCSISMAK